MAAVPDYEQAGELKIGQVGIANLRVRTLDVARLVAEMRERVERAPKLFTRAAVIVDFGGLARTPDAASVRELLDGLKDAGVLPVALAYGTSENDALAQQLGLPLLAKFRAQYESAGQPTDSTVGAASAAKRTTSSPRNPPLEGDGSSPAAAARGERPGTAAAVRSEEAAPTRSESRPPAVQPAGPGLMHVQPVRSGQQVYAQNRDLTVCAPVGAGAEVIADGSVHVYGALRGRALAGAQGDERARIFCREFHAELVAVAGHYKVLEEIPKTLRGKAVQIWLENDKLRIEELGRVDIS